MNIHARCDIALQTKDEAIAFLQKEVERLQKANDRLTEALVRPKEVEYGIPEDLAPQFHAEIQGAIDQMAGPHEIGLRRDLEQYAQAATIAGDEPGDVAAAIRQGTDLEEMLD